MSSQTTNLQLVKPAYGESADVATHNTNMDLIDAAYASTVTAINGKAAKGDAIKNITRSGTTFTATRAEGTSFTFTQQDNDHYAWSDITGKPSNYPGGCTGTAGGVAWGNVSSKPASYPGGCTGTAGGVAWGNVSSKPSYYDGAAIKNITRSGTTFTATKMDGTTFTFTQQDTNTTYNNATTSTAGLMSAADKTKLNGIATGANAYSLPLAANGTRGGVQLGYSTNGKNYAVQQSGEKLYVNVPWVDTNTNTWRGIQNNLTSTSTTDSLSAAQGKALNDKISGAFKVSIVSPGGSWNIGFTPSATLAFWYQSGDAIIPVCMNENGNWNVYSKGGGSLLGTINMNGSTLKNNTSLYLTCLAFYDY